MKRKSVPHTIEKLIGMHKRGTLKFDNPIQRPPDQWDFKKKSLLIDSMLNMFVPDVYALEYTTEKTLKNDKVQNVTMFDILDGKQRLTTMISYVNDEWVLEGLKHNVTLNETTSEEYSINSKRFSELPKEVQAELKGFVVTFNVIELEENDDEINIVDEIFYRLNNGTPVSKEHLSLTKANKTIQEFTRRIVDTHPLFTTVAHYTKGQLKKSDKEFTVLQSIVMNSGLDYLSFSAKHIEEFFVYNDVSDEILMKVEMGFDAIAQAFEEYNKFVTKIHIPTMVLLSDRPRFAEFILDYAANTDKNDAYRRFCGAGCTKKENVRGRIQTMGNFYDSYVARNPIVEPPKPDFE